MDSNLFLVGLVSSILILLWMSTSILRKIKIDVEDDWIKGIGYSIWGSMTSGLALLVWLAIAAGLPAITPEIYSILAYRYIIVLTLFAPIISMIYFVRRGVSLLTTSPSRLVGIPDMWNAPIGLISIFAVLVIIISILDPAPPYLFTDKTLAVYEPLNEPCVGGSVKFDLKFTVRPPDNHIMAIQFGRTWHRVDRPGIIGSRLEDEVIYRYSQDTDVDYGETAIPLHPDVTAGLWTVDSSDIATGAGYSIRNITVLDCNVAYRIENMTKKNFTRLIKDE